MTAVFRNPLKDGDIITWNDYNWFCMEKNNEHLIVPLSVTFIVNMLPKEKQDVYRCRDDIKTLMKWEGPLQETYGCKKECRYCRTHEEPTYM